MRRDILAVVVLVVIGAVIAVLLLSLPHGPARAEITAVTTDKPLYHSNEMMKIAVAVNSAGTTANTTIRFEGIRDQHGSMRLSHEISAPLAPGAVVIPYDYQLPPCSSCAGLPAGTYQFHVTLVFDGVIISNVTHSVQIEQ